jgi:AmmeMemoRadiSam system protein A
MLNSEQRRAVLSVAHASIDARVAGRPYSVGLVSGLPPAAGVFVTVKVLGELRGCLGTLECRHDLQHEIARCAADAASADPRFMPVTVEQLSGLTVEVSILGPLERIDPLASGAVIVGVHGLVIEQGRHRGLLLPQVASERRWTVEQFLDQTCIKANLPPGAWRHGAVVYRFAAEVFGADDCGERESTAENVE